MNNSLGAALQNAFGALSKKKQLDLIKEQAYRQFAVLRRFQPLALGIDQQLCTALTAYNEHLVLRFLAIHCRSRRYLRSIAQGGKRFNLLGKVQGSVSAEEQKHADSQIKEPPTLPAVPPG